MAGELELFSFLPTIFQTPVVYTAIVVIILVIIIYALIKKRNLSISIFGRKIVNVEGALMNGSKKDKDTKLLNNYGKPKHLGCDHVNDFILVISETTNVVSEISEIKFKGCISEQISRSDQHVSRIKALLQSSYRDKLIKLNDPTTDTIGSYKFFQALTGIIITDIKDQIIRPSFLMNHLADRSNELEYLEYINKQYLSIKSLNKEITSDMYLGDYALSQEEVLAIYDDDDIEKEIKNIVKDIYYDAKDIAIKKKNKIEELQKGLKEFVKKIVGING